MEINIESTKFKTLPHILIPVYFKAPLGGLQAHVYAQAKAIKDHGWKTTVLCKAGPFAKHCTNNDINVIEDDFSDIDASVENICKQYTFNLIHAHPFLSRKLGQKLAQRMRIPIVETIHGQYTDELEQGNQNIKRIYCVSPAIRDNLLKEGTPNAHKILILPNAVNLNLFYPGPDTRKARLYLLRKYFQKPLSDRDRVIVFACRLGNDKHFILDCIRDAWEEQAQRSSFRWRWLVAGDGPARNDLEVAGKTLNTAANLQCVEFLGWQSEQILSRLYQAADLVVAPGRSALDCLACSRPVIAIGSKSYIGLIDEEKWYKGAYTNFGGVGKKEKDYETGRLYADIDSVIYNDERLTELGAAGFKRVVTFHNQFYWNNWLITQYQELLSAHSKANVDKHWTQIKGLDLDFFTIESKDTLSPTWNLHGRVVKSDIKALPSGGLQLSYETERGKGFYLANGCSNFNLPASGQSLWICQENCTYEFRGDFQIVSGNVSLRTWLIEYTDTRLAHAIYPTKPGQFRLPYDIKGPCRSIRIAFKFSGKGTVKLSPLSLYSTPSQPITPKNTTRTPYKDGFADYLGQNVVFILGAPRSGTTWLLKLLSEHPQIIAATVDNLDARINDNKTLETNIFTPNRFFTDNGIRERFYRFSLENPEKIIVEKTPIHTLQHTRIDRVFPKSQFIIIERDPRDIITSLVHVGRDKNAWWKGAPDTIEKATTLWLEYAKAIKKCKILYSPLCVSYENMLNNTKLELESILTSIGLSVTSLDELVDKSSNGRNIDIPGVFRSGTKGGWREFFTIDDLETFAKIAGALAVGLEE